MEALSVDPQKGKPPHWSKRDWEEVKRYLVYLRDELGLRDWDIFLCFDTTADEDDVEALASIHATDSQRNARMWLAKDFREQRLELQRRALIHELLHLHARDSADIIRLTLPKVLGGTAYEVLWENYRQQVELMVDSLAVAIAPRFALIDWPASKKRKQKKERQR